MPLTALTPVSVIGPYPGAVVADQLDFSFTAADAANGNSIPLTGKEILIVFNAHASNAYTFSLASQYDQWNRKGDVTNYSLAAGEYAAFCFVNGQHGWADGDGNLQFSANNAAIKFAVIKLP